MRSFTLFRVLPYINCAFAFYALYILFPLFYGDTWFYIVWFQIFANWVCTLVYHSKCGGSISNGPALKEIIDKQGPWSYQSGFNGHFCPTCDMLWPQHARVHHCPLCKACISQHDHHCFFVGVCIGDKNQRYFLALMLHVSLCCAYVVFNMARSLREDNDEPVWKLLLPVAFLSCSMHPTSMCDSFSKLFVLNVMMSIGLCAVAVCIFQALLVYRGQTPHEFHSGKPVSAVKSLKGNIRYVFGRFGLWHFVFPIPKIELFISKRLRKPFIE